jgi:excisionase family DNA binding protein
MGLAYILCLLYVANSTTVTWTQWTACHGTERGEELEDKRMPHLLRAEEVVSLTGWSRAKVYAMAAAGDLPSLRSGRSVRIPLAALERWIEQNTTGGAVQ